MFFTKGHGTGNDFVIIADPDGELDLTPERVARLCHRRFGIGADGVLRVVRSAKHPEGAGFAADAEWFMDYRNSDGSIAEMCGNGVRVFARYLLTHELATPGGGVPIATRAGVVHAVVQGENFKVKMRDPRVYAASTATVGHLTFPGVAVDCGNPHLVCGLHDGVSLDALDLNRAPGHDTGVFPAGVNVEFATPLAEPVTGADLHVAMRVYERGSTETLSCGSGALAVGAVALRDAGLSTGVVAVDLPGGRLTVTHDAAGDWWLGGPAVLVATGSTEL